MKIFLFSFCFYFLFFFSFDGPQLCDPGADIVASVWVLTKPLFMQWKGPVRYSAGKIKIYRAATSCLRERTKGVSKNGKKNLLCVIVLAAQWSSFIQCWKRMLMRGQANIVI